MEIEQNARSPGAGDFFGDDGRMPEVTAAASVFVGKSRAKQPGLTGRSPEVARDPASFLPRAVVRYDFRGHETADGILENQMLFLVFRGHYGVLSPCCTGGGWLPA